MEKPDWSVSCKLLFSVFLLFVIFIMVYLTSPALDECTSTLFEISHAW